jgi:hypothetical protein
MNRYNDDKSKKARPGQNECIVNLYRAAILRHHHHVRWLYIVCRLNTLPFFYQHLLMALITLVVFQMIGGMTDFYRSWRGVRFMTELVLLLQNWTSVLSLAPVWWRFAANLTIPLPSILPGICSAAQG